MKKIIILLVILALCTISNSGFAQGKKIRLQPGKFYEAGESIYAPRFGFSATIPEGWQGSLPRESEVFLLQTITTDVFGEIYVFGSERSDLASLEKTWREGTDLSETIRIKALIPVVKGDMITSEIVGEGQAINKGNRAYAVARCNPDGPCIIALSIMPKQFYESIKNSLEHFMLASSFEPPNTASPYATLNWNEFLANKALVTYVYVEGGSKDTDIHLCADGTFTATIKKTGFMKNQSPQYHGKLNGTWAAKGIGENTNLTFIFSSKRNLPPIEVSVTIKEDKVYANDERYFVAQSTRCK
jgi:hypothetical protein